MKHPITEMLHPQFHQLEQQITAEFKIRSGNILDYITLPDPERNFVEYYLPALLVLLFGRGATTTSSKVVDMGCVVEFIYLGTKVHYHLSEEDDTTTQYPILVGDYLYGKFYTTLCKANCLHFLAPLSRAIMAIHQASIKEEQSMAHSNTKALVSQLYQEKWGELFGLCCSIGLLTKNNKSSEEASDQLTQELVLAQQLGLSIGVYYGLLTADKQNLDWVNEAKSQVLENCKQIEVHMGLPLIAQAIKLMLESLQELLVCKHPLGRQSILVG